MIFKSCFVDIVLNKTKNAFLWTWILRSPFWVVYNLLLFILYKDLHATPFQIALFVALKPMSSIFSMYWSSYINKRPDRLISNITWGGLIAYLPFLILPFYGGAWYLLFASIIFIMMHRAIVPGWMEILKLNLPGDLKNKVFSYASMASYIVGCLLPIAMGPALDKYPNLWRYLFSLFAFLGLLTFFFQKNIPICCLELKSHNVFSFKDFFLDPWRRTLSLLKTRKDFSFYQVGFMFFGGAGLMIMQPVLPQFFIDVLKLSYTELSIALSICKGIGFALFSPLWTRLIGKIDIYQFSFCVIFLAALFPLILISAQYQIVAIYLAYLLYGILQAGSELSWHLSGPLFSKQEDSSAYTSINVLTVGLRGLIVPQLGSFFALFLASPSILMLGAFLCFIGAFWLLLARKKVFLTLN